MIVSVSFGCKTEAPLPPNTYEINGAAEGVVNGLRAYIKVVEGNREKIIDTAIVMNETFTFKGEALIPSISRITINSIQGNLPFVLESGRINVKINKDSLFYSIVQGTKNNEDYHKYKGVIKERVKGINSLKAQINQSTPQEKINEINLLGRKKTVELQEYAYEFINNNVNSDFSLLLLETQVGRPNLSLTKVKESFNNLQGVIKRNPHYESVGKKINDYIAVLEARANIDIGKVAPNFSSPTPEGEMLALNDIKGKATIIDFWASWCGPCRRENPNVVSVYEKYHGKGLEIISVSLDKPGQKDRWLKAIEDDKLTWNHVGSLQYFNDPVARMYNVNSIPSMFVLDESGTIVGKKLRGQALHNKISELLD
jgi:thiol-disulfide isomerase/thioredoxin